MTCWHVNTRTHRHNNNNNITAHGDDKMTVAEGRGGRGHNWRCTMARSNDIWQITLSFVFSSATLMPSPSFFSSFPFLFYCIDCIILYEFPAIITIQLTCTFDSFHVVRVALLELFKAYRGPSQHILTYKNYSSELVYFVNFSNNNLPNVSKLRWMSYLCFESFYFI